MSFITKQIIRKTGVLTLNNPAKRNALSSGLLGELLEGLEAFAKDRLPVVVLRAEKDAKVWSSGFDIKELPRTHRDPLGYDSPLEKTLRAVQSYPGPVIAMVQGGVWGGACDLAVTSDILIGDNSCSFAITPVKIGIPYNASGILHFINRVGMNVAKEMFFTAEPINAERALHCGLLNHLIPAEKLEDFTFAMADKIGGYSALSAAVIKEQFRILSGAHPISPASFERIQGLRRRVYDSHDYEEGINAFIEKRPPLFRGE